MRDDYRRCIMTQCRFHNFARMNFGMVNRAEEERFMLQQTMLIIEIDNNKDFALLLCQIEL